MSCLRDNLLRVFWIVNRCIQPSPAMYLDSDGGELRCAESGRIQRAGWFHNCTQDLETYTLEHV